MPRRALLALAALALLPPAAPRLYERCDLARDLARLAVRADHIATWVCIAFHESRFDTAANNPYSGDHGLLQISELYWCGPAKACGRPCSAFRDDDIADDVQCALQIYEEHTRLQGNGFLAWVVYPQHCKHNTKKYLIDCGDLTKTIPTKPENKARALTPASIDRNVNKHSFENNPKIDELLPPYLKIPSFLRSGYGDDNSITERHNWINYKVDNIDDLVLPIFDSESRTTSTTSPPTSSIKPIVPWRSVETNQFRIKTSTVAPTQASVTVSNVSVTSTLPTYNIYTSTTKRPTAATSSTKTLISSTITTTTATTRTSTATETPSTRSTWKFRDATAYSFSTPQLNLTSTPQRKHGYSFGTSIGGASSTRNIPNYYTPITTYNLKAKTIKPVVPFSTTTTPRTKFKYSDVSTTKSVSIPTLKPFLFDSFQGRYNWSTTTSRPLVTSSTTSSISTPFWSRSTTAPPTFKPRNENAASTVPPAAASLTTKRATQSIFDLYLNPTTTRRPVYKYAPSEGSKYRLKIFFDGTTTHSPLSKSKS